MAAKQKIVYEQLIPAEQAPAGSPINRVYVRKQEALKEYHRICDEFSQLQSEIHKREGWLQSVRFGVTDPMEYLKTKAELEILQVTLEAKREEKAEAGRASDATDTAFRVEYARYAEAVQRIHSSQWPNLSGDQREQEVYKVIEAALTPVA